MWSPPPVEYFEAIAQLVALLYLAAIFEAGTGDWAEVEPFLEPDGNTAPSAAEEEDNSVVAFLRAIVAAGFLFTLTALTVSLFAALASIVSPSKTSTVVATLGLASALNALLYGAIAKRVSLAALGAPYDWLRGALVTYLNVLLLAPLAFGIWASFRLT